MKPVELNKMRKLIYLLATVYFLGLFAVGAWVHQASFPSWQRRTITGVIIGAFADEAEAVHISARRLQCNDPAGSDIYAPATCIGSLAGQVLQIQATRNPPEHPNTLDGVCQAVYNGQPWPCNVIHMNQNLGSTIMIVNCILEIRLCLGVRTCLKVTSIQDSQMAIKRRATQLERQRPAI